MNLSQKSTLSAGSSATLHSQPQEDIILFKIPPLKARLYVKHICCSISKEVLFDLFSRFGLIYKLLLSDEDSLVRQSDPSVIDTSGNINGEGNADDWVNNVIPSNRVYGSTSRSETTKFALVYFHSIEEARRAQRSLHGIILEDLALKVLSSDSTNPMHNSYSDSVVLSSAQCIKVANHFIGFGNWSCSISNLKRFKVRSVLEDFKLGKLVEQHKVDDTATDTPQRKRKKYGHMKDLYRHEVMVEIHVTGPYGRDETVSGVGFCYSCVNHTDVSREYKESYSIKGKSIDWLSIPQFVSKENAYKVAVSRARAAAFSNLAIVRMNGQLKCCFCLDCDFDSDGE